MKINSFTQSLVVAALSAVALSSCQTSLMSAVKQGDVAAVRKAIESGVPAGELNAAASVAYSKGNTAVVDELIKSGAVAAPDSVAYKKVEIQTTWWCFDEEHAVERPDISSVSLFAQYWANKGVNHVWVKDTYSNIKNLADSGTLKAITWKDGNLIKVKAGDGTENNHQLEYKRTGANTGFVIYDFSNDRIIRSFEFHTYYLLSFETPTSGTFKCIEREVCYSRTEHWSIGRFWLKDVPQEPKKETKKSSKKKRK